MSDDKDELDLHVAPHLRERPSRSKGGPTRPVLCSKCYTKMTEEDYGWRCEKCGKEHRWKEKND